MPIKLKHAMKELSCGIAFECLAECNIILFFLNIIAEC